MLVSVRVRGLNSISRCRAATSHDFSLPLGENLLRPFLFLRICRSWLLAIVNLIADFMIRQAASKIACVSEISLAGNLCLGTLAVYQIWRQIQHAWLSPGVFQWRNLTTLDSLLQDYTRDECR